MTANPRAGRRALDVVAAAGLALGLAACVADGGPGLSGSLPGLAAAPVVQVEPAAPVAPAAAVESRSAVYDCGADGTITVEPMTSAVRLVEADGASYDLPASPPTQASRFGEGNAALVVEGGEALWMKAGREPMACRR